MLAKDEKGKRQTTMTDTHEEKKKKQRTLPGTGTQQQTINYESFLIHCYL
jgi:hypothetical protein